MTFNYQIDDGIHAIDQQLELDWHRGYQVINAAGGSNLLSAGTNDFDVDSASGDINFGGSTVACTAQTVNLSGVVDPDNPRKVTVYRDGNGDLNYQAGTAQAASPSGATRRNASEPAPPTLYNTDAVVLGTVWVAAGATSITSADIRDRRLPAELNVESLGRDLDAQGNDITGVGSLDTAEINNSGSPVSIEDVIKLASDSSITSDVDSTFGFGFEDATLNDGETAVIDNSINRGDIWVFVADETNNGSAIAHNYGNVNVNGIDIPSGWSTSFGNNGTKNIAHDGNNFAFVIENQTGSQIIFNWAYVTVNA